VRFSIENRPEDQPATLQALIKEARVTNLATGQSQQTTTFTDNDMEFDVDLKAAAANQIEIKLVDVNQNVIMKTVTITTR
jgi:DNA-binding FadR family transcriptional regulator